MNELGKVNYRMLHSEKNSAYSDSELPQALACGKKIIAPKGFSQTENDTEIQPEQRCKGVSVPEIDWSSATFRNYVDGYFE